MTIEKRAELVGAQAEAGEVESPMNLIDAAFERELGLRWHQSSDTASFDMLQRAAIEMVADGASYSLTKFIPEGKTPIPMLVSVPAPDSRVLICPVSKEDINPPEGMRNSPPAEELISPLLWTLLRLRVGQTKGGGIDFRASNAKLIAEIESKSESPKNVAMIRLIRAIPYMTYLAATHTDQDNLQTLLARQVADIIEPLESDPDIMAQIFGGLFHLGDYFGEVKTSIQTGTQVGFKSRTDALKVDLQTIRDPRDPTTPVLTSIETFNAQANSPNPNREELARYGHRVLNQIHNHVLSAESRLTSHASLLSRGERGLIAKRLEDLLGHCRSRFSKTQRIEDIKNGIKNASLLWIDAVARVIAPAQLKATVAQASQSGRVNNQTLALIREIMLSVSSDHDGNPIHSSDGSLPRFDQIHLEHLTRDNLTQLLQKMHGDQDVDESVSGDLPTYEEYMGFIPRSEHLHRDVWREAVVSVVQAHDNLDAGFIFEPDHRYVAGRLRRFTRRPALPGSDEADLVDDPELLQIFSLYTEGIKGRKVVHGHSNTGGFSLGDILGPDSPFAALAKLSNPPNKQKPNAKAYRTQARKMRGGR